MKHLREITTLPRRAQATDLSQDEMNLIERILDDAMLASAVFSGAVLIAKKL